MRALALQELNHAAFTFEKYAESLLERRSVDIEAVYEQRLRIDKALGGLARLYGGDLRPAPSQKPRSLLYTVDSVIDGVACFANEGVDWLPDAVKFANSIVDSAQSLWELSLENKAA